mgnify:FL=1
MSKIFLVRHGQDTDNARSILNGRRNTNLTMLGRRQARIVAHKLQKFGIDIIYVSPLKRARQTASIIAKYLSIKRIIVDKRLVERNFGILTGKPISDIPRYTKKILRGHKIIYFLRGKNVEEFPAVYRRGRQALKNIIRRHRNKSVLIVTHGDIGKMIRAAFFGWNWEKGLKTRYFGNTDILELSFEPLGKIESSNSHLKLISHCSSSKRR